MQKKLLILCIPLLFIGCSGVNEEKPCPKLSDTNPKERYNAALRCTALQNALQTNRKVDFLFGESAAKWTAVAIKTGGLLDKKPTDINKEISSGTFMAHQMKIREVTAEASALECEKL